MRHLADTEVRMITENNWRLDKWELGNGQQTKGNGHNMSDVRKMLWRIKDDFVFYLIFFLGKGNKGKLFVFEEQIDLFLRNRGVNNVSLFDLAVGAQEAYLQAALEADASSMTV